MKKLLTTLLLVGSLAAAAQKHITGRVISVHDGDTFTILACDSLKLNVRLWGIDAPELKQPYGIEARECLRGLIMGTDVVVFIEGHEKYGRLLGTLRTHPIDFTEPRCVNEMMVYFGYAWVYTPNIKQSDNRQVDYAFLFNTSQTKAMSYFMGLWADANPTPPWEYRKNKKK